MAAKVSRVPESTEELVNAMKYLRTVSHYNYILVTYL